jgi:hypothetical protein
MKLLKEVTQEVQIITESIDSGKEKKYFIEGVFIQGDIKNKNGRVYPMTILDKEIQRYNEEYIQHNRAYGELGHPDTPVINLERVSHMIRSLKKEGNNYVGKAEILNTPNGNIVKALMEAGASLGVSSRGIGSLKQEGEFNTVQDDFRLMTAADIVSDPSAPDAFVNAVMEEKEWLFVDGVLVPVLEGYKKNIKNTSSLNLNEEKIRIFKDYLSRL